MAASSDLRYPRAPVQVSTTGHALGEVLVELRHGRGMDQGEVIKRAEEFGASVGLAVTALSHYERGRRVPAPAHLLSLVRALDPSPEDFKRLVQAAAKSSPTYQPVAVLVEGGQWTREAWEGWAAGFQPRMPRKQPKD